MNKTEFDSLKPGDWVSTEEPCFTVGIIETGHWTNWINGKSGFGRYVCWDDGDRSCVGLEMFDDRDIALLEKSDTPFS